MLTAPVHRLLNINSYHYRRGGADVVYLDHAALFESMGWANAFFAMHHPLNEATPWSEYFVDELQYGSSYGTLQKIRMAGKVIYSVEARKKIERLIDDFRPDVAHAHNLYHHLSPSVLSALRARGVPTVMTAHDYKLACPSHEMLQGGKVCERCKGGRFLNCITHRCIKDSVALSALVALESAVHRAAGSYVNYLDRIVVPSRFMGDRLAEWGIPRRLIHHIPNAVDPRGFEPSDEVGDYLVYLGRLTASKGVRTLIEAARRTGVPLVVVGTGELEDELRTSARGCDNVHLVGRKSGAELWRLVSGSRAVVLPSEWYENAPMSILEAYALNRPVLAAEIGGIPEMIDVGRTGWLFRPGDAGALADAMQQVFSLSSIRLREMGMHARQLVEERFSTAAYRARMVELYRDLGVQC
jgi:glycosyltransferase involved in cell wall biosynthesis